MYVYISKYICIYIAEINCHKKKGKKPTWTWHLETLIILRFQWSFSHTMFHGGHGWTSGWCCCTLGHSWEGCLCQNTDCFVEHFGWQSLQFLLKCSLIHFKEFKQFLKCSFCQLQCVLHCFNYATLEIRKALVVNGKFSCDQIDCINFYLLEDRIRCRVKLEEKPPSISVFAQRRRNMLTSA